MKQIFTLILCLAGLSAAAADITVEQCIGIALGNNTATLNASALQQADINCDGIVDINDVTLLIDQRLGVATNGSADRIQQTASGDDLDGIVNEVLDGQQQLPAVNQCINDQDNK